MIRRTANYLDTEIDGETILMQIESGQIYSATDSAKEIWDLLIEPIEFGKLIDRLVTEFDVDRDTCTEDVSRFLAMLQKQNIIEVGPETVRSGRAD